MDKGGIYIIPEVIKRAVQNRVAGNVLLYLMFKEFFVGFPVRYIFDESQTISTIGSSSIVFLPK